MAFKIGDKVVLYSSCFLTNAKVRIKELLLNVGKECGKVN